MNHFTKKILLNPAEDIQVIDILDDQSINPPETSKQVTGKIVEKVRNIVKEICGQQSSEQSQTELKCPLNVGSGPKIECSFPCLLPPRCSRCGVRCAL